MQEKTDSADSLASPDMAAEAVEAAPASGGGKVNRGVVIALVVSLVAMVVLGLWGAGLIGGGDSTDAEAPAAEATSTTPIASGDSSIVAPGTVVNPLDAATDPSVSGTEAVIPTDTTPPPVPRQIFPAVEEVLEGPEMEFRWSSVRDESEVSYTLEIETYSLDAKAFVAYRTFTNLPETTFFHEMPTYLERWRIWAVDSAGNASEATEWRTFSRKLLTTPVSPTD